MLDTGDENVPQYVKSLMDVLRDEKVDLEHVIISHWHHDHIGGVKNIFKDLPCKSLLWVATLSIIFDLGYSKLYQI